VLEEITKNNVFNSPARLSIALYLLPRRRVSFAELQKALNMTPGNLESHLKKLERVGYVRIFKGFADRPRTFIEITDKGARETIAFLRLLKKAIDEALHDRME